MKTSERHEGGKPGKPAAPKQRTKRIAAMSDVNTTTPKAKAKAASYASDLPKFEIPRFDLPKFEVPKMEVPAAFRELAEKSVSQAKDNWEKMKAATEEATDMIEDSYATASRGAADYGLKLIEAMRANTNASFDMAAQLLTVKSLSEAVEVSTSHVRKQFDAMNSQTKELSALAQKVATETCEPIKDSVTSVFKKVA
jgi:phasin